MVEAVEADEGRTKRVRSPGVRYPGSSLASVHAALGVLNAAGGTATIGTLAARTKFSETNAQFVRLVASARSYGLAEWTDNRKNTLRLTPDGAAMFGTDEAAAALAKQHAVLLPDVFQKVARTFEGRAVASGEDLIEAFVVVGVAPSAADLAARNFIESVDFAGLAENVDGRKLLHGDLPYPEVDLAVGAAMTRPGAAATRAAIKETRSVVPASIEKSAANARMPQSVITSGVSVTVNIDVSGWSVDDVVRLVNRLGDEPQIA